MTPITLSTALIRMLVSVALGAMIGVERQIHHHPAGFRTFTLICTASTLAMLVSIYVCQTNTDLLNGDPGRIAAQVLTGIGFIGAGLILKGNDGVSGLTTAACIFVCAVIGLAVGSGMLLLSAIITVAVVIILWSAYFIHGDKKNQKKQEQNQ
ncbi:MAG: MgtC/SapB family protein [Bacteroidales bacterium]|nr:MgtC/SapB family protein [Bacteroidales bacterium]